MKSAPAGLPVTVRTAMASTSPPVNKLHGRRGQQMLVGSSSSSTDDCSTSCSDYGGGSSRSVQSRSSSSSLDEVLGAELKSMREEKVLKHYSIDPVKEGRKTYGTDARDVGTPDAWITGRHPDMLRLTGELCYPWLRNLEVAQGLIALQGCILLTASRQWIS